MSKRKPKSDGKPASEQPDEQLELEATERGMEMPEAGEVEEGEFSEHPEAIEVEVGELILEDLRAELDEARSQADEYLDGWQRSRAEFANYRKRMERQQMESYERASAQIVSLFLDMLDDLELALKDRPVGNEDSDWAAGIALIYRKLNAILESLGLETVPAEGLGFDPNLHDAISYEESKDHLDGDIIEVIRKGYKLGDRILRPATVRVAKQEQ